MTKTIQTGFIHPRDYGISINRRQDNFFFTPFKYALAKIMLETPNEISVRLEKFANEKSSNSREIKSLFKEQVKKKEGSLDIIRFSRDNVIKSVSAYGNYRVFYDAKVSSKSNYKQEPYRVSLENAFIDTTGDFYSKSRRCNCPDSHYSEIKRRTINCIHISALELALNQDNKSRESKEENITKLTKSQRPSKVIMPFDFSKEDNDLLLTNALWQYYVEEYTQFNINKQLLENFSIYSPSLLEAINNSCFDRVKFVVLRNNEKQENKKSLISTQQRFYGASNALEERIINKLNTIGFSFRGYGLEFKGTEDEIAAKRFQHRDNSYQIISLCTPQNIPPIMIKKFLGAKEFSQNYISKPLRFNIGKYEDIDDTTKRSSLNQIFIPGEKENSDIFVAQILKESYDMIKNSYK